MAEVPGITPDCELTLVEDAYTEKDARIHFLRTRELIGAAGDRTDLVQGINAGISLHDHVSKAAGEQEAANGTSKTEGNKHALSDYEIQAPSSYKILLLPSPGPAPKTVKSISLSPWNPAPYHLRLKGHLLYIQLTTMEGEQYQITGHVSGFFVNKSSNGKFDPYPKIAPKSYHAHSLLNLISKLSPSFDASFKELLDFNNQRDPLAMFQPSNAIPNSPWLVSRDSNLLSAHQPDVARSQESYLISGAENTETLRDWNEEFQTTRELPRETVQDRVFRERVMNKLYADYNEAATQGAVLIARGEIAPVNPTENPDAQIFVYNNVFYSFGADGVGTFASEGGDEAARVATGKDVTGVRHVNQLDIHGLCAPGTVIVDYLGKRMVGQSIVPGIFKQREPGEQQIDYGGVEGKDIVAENEAFIPLFQKLSQAMRVKKHTVWDKEGKKHDLEASVETKGLLGTDGRKYVLDLYRVTPLDIFWIEKYWSEISAESEAAESKKDSKKNYPHRMTVLRPELVEAYWRSKLREFARVEMAKQPGNPEKKEIANGDSSKSATETAASTQAESTPASDANSDKPAEEEKALTNGHAEEQTTSTNAEGEKETKKEEDDAEPKVDLSGFEFALNPDVFSGQHPQTDQERAEMEKDEAAVRAACTYLHEEVLPRLVADLKESEVGFPMDGQSLSSLIHRRGINIRYLGQIADMASTSEPRLQALKALATQEIVSRAFKHIANRHLKYLPSPFAAACVAHLLNCLLGTEFNDAPTAILDEELKAMYPEAKFDFVAVTPATLRTEISEQVSLRYRHDLAEDWSKDLKPMVMLREISLKLGLQLCARDYAFTKDQVPTTNGSHQTNGDASHAQINGTNGTNSGSTKKKGKKAGVSTPPTKTANQPPQTFHPDDVYNIVPILKETSPRSLLAEEALEAGRMSIVQNQRELGQELLLESLSLHEQIYGILHAEVARVYYQLSTLFYGLEDKSIAVELARKSVIVAERTLGPDAHETVLGYLNLGLFEHAVGNTHRALAYIRHALDLWKLVYGAAHPDSITTINNAAVMLQHLKLYHDSRLWFETSLEISQRVSGKSSVNTATLLFQLAQALALDQDPKGAVNRMREAFSIFNAELGPDDRNTKEAETWLEQLTQNAVSIARHAKDVQARRARRVAQLTPRVTMEARPQRLAGQSEREAVDAGAGAGASAAAGKPVLDGKTLDELVKYIEGGEKQKTPKKAANPKRRAQ